ncbi:unnamed protein product [Cuscuta campestris]|uniref:MADS-box domain-containing protein n=1 Tax=Cuscuta campestris TaxID=132261 RepID=A0A484LGV9_9ASTE|nr:unnamed protein product [Cuscuta campestris]
MERISKTKKTQGRRKIDIIKIDNVNHRHVAFSKRRIGLFNKASELCILCGTHVAAIVESYGGKRVFTFGHPSADAVIEHYLSGGGGAGLHDREDDPVVKRSEQLYQQAWRELEKEKEKGVVVEERKWEGGGCGAHWWDMPIDGMDVKELEEYTAALEELKKKVALRVGELETAAMMTKKAAAAAFCCGSSSPPPLLEYHDYHHAG